MTHLGYLIAGWGISLVTIGFYAASLRRRGQTLAAAVPPSERRWMTASRGTGEQAGNR